MYVWAAIIIIIIAAAVPVATAATTLLQLLVIQEHSLWLQIQTTSMCVCVSVSAGVHGVSSVQTRSPFRQKLGRCLVIRLSNEQTKERRDERRDERTKELLWSPSSSFLFSAFLFLNLRTREETELFFTVLPIRSPLAWLLSLFVVHRQSPVFDIALVF